MNPIFIQQLENLLKAAKDGKIDSVAFAYITNDGTGLHNQAWDKAAESLVGLMMRQVLDIAVARNMAAIVNRQQMEHDESKTVQ